MVFDIGDALTGFAGGTLIGLGAAVLLLGNQRIAGVSGVLSGLFARISPKRGENAAFLLALMAVPVAMGLLVGPPGVSITVDPWLLLAGGLLVGYGTRLGNGCTSGHGVCGLSRFSLRSLMATVAFMAAGMLTASVLRPMIGG